MGIKQTFLRRWTRGAGTMLGKIRTLYFGFVLFWPILGVLGSDITGSLTRTAAVVAATVALEVWLLTGYLRQQFPAWSWVVEGCFVCVVAAASGFGGTIAVLFLWVNFRALYGRLREKVLAAVVIAAVMTVGVVVADGRAAEMISLLATALMSLAVTHVLAKGCSANDRSAVRERAVSLAGAGLAAATTREEAMSVTLGAALSIDQEIDAALLCTVAGPALHVSAAVGRVGDDAAGWVTEAALLPEQARSALQTGRYTVLTASAAAELTAVLRLRSCPMVVVSPLSVHGATFGMLVLAASRRPLDDLSAAVTTLAGEAALTLDQLLSQSRLSVVVEHSPDALMLAAESGTIRFVNPAAEIMLASPGSELIGRELWSLVHPDDLPTLLAGMHGTPAQGPLSCRIRGRGDATWVDVDAIVEYVSEHDGSQSIIFNGRDVSERQRLELELRHAQKLESVGRLAAGIAHEINTPIQFVSDNVRFLQTAIADLQRLQDAYRSLAVAAAAHPDCAEALAEVESVSDDIDIDFVMEEAPLAVSQSLEGVTRVANIVRAMKAFGHPGTEEKTQADLNEAIGHTLVVANNEIKYVADVETELGELPLVHCHLGDINQVVLNLVVNAAHAIGSADRGRGTIRVTTRQDGEHIAIEVADTGTGMPPDVAAKIFDPFFTTKDVGTGTGQGLALVRTLIVDRHGGTIDFTSEPGVGTVFTVRLPVSTAENTPTAPELTEATQ